MQCLSRHLKHYQSLVQDLTSHFTAFNISPIPRLQNASADIFANVASNLFPQGDYNPNQLSIELFFRPSIPDNITNWRVFNNDLDIITFLNIYGSYDDQIIDKDHDSQLKQEIIADSIPKFVVKLEDLYDLKDRFKEPTNSKLQISTLRFELVNLGTDLKPQNTNLGLDITSNERLEFII